MSNKANLINDLIDKLTTRERVLVLVGFLAVIYMVWDTFLLSPVIKQNDALQTELLSIESQMSDLVKREKLATGLLTHSKRKQLQDEITRIEKKINDFDSQISQRLQGRVAPEEMASLLNDVLQNNQKLEILRLNNLEAEPFVSSASKNQNKESGDSSPVDPDLVGIFKHSMELELQGSYLDILEYLQELETLKWKIFWDEVTMDVEEYPKVKVYIKVHTFSLKDGWLSV